MTSLTSLGTGRAPGEHGVLGYQVIVPGQHSLLNGLRWDDRIDPERGSRSRRSTSAPSPPRSAAYYVAPRAFRESGLTRAAMRGAQYRPADSMGALAGQAAVALNDAANAIVTVYHGDLDATGHTFGVGSEAWYYQLAHVDKLAEQMAGVLPGDSALYVTADHGMVDIPPRTGSTSDLDRTCAAASRCSAVRAAPGTCTPSPVPPTTCSRCGARSWASGLGRLPGRGHREGWFGPVDPAMAARIGDVVAATAGNWAIVATQTEPRESALAGMHGSLASADQLIPMLTLPVN